MSKDFKMKGLEFKDGILKMFEERVVLIPPSIISLLGSVFGQGSKPLLYYLGKKMGRKLVETWEEHLKPKNLEDLTNIFISMTGLAGWGSFNVIKISDEEIIVHLKYNIAKEESHPSNHICDFIAGYLSGFGEYAMFSANVVETKCSILDPSLEYCEFKITKRT